MNRTQRNRGEAKTQFARASVAGALLSFVAMGCGSASDGKQGSPNSSSAGGTAQASDGSQSTTGGSSATTTGGTTNGNGGTVSSGGSMATGGSAGANGGSAGSGGSEPLPPADGTPGEWEEVTPAEMNMDTSWGGLQTVLADPARPTDVYANADSEGTWRSTDYGLTWTKASTGTHATELDSGRQWYAAIDLNPARDPATDPALYVTLGYGTNGLWRSSNAGVDWDNAWGTIYAPDGTTDISSDVGGDIHSVHVIDEQDPNHILVTLHSYWGDGDNNGVFESTDGGQTFVVHKSQTFNFQPHADLVFPYDATTWLVTHVTTWPNCDLLRTTNAGDSWEVVDQLCIGRQIAKVGTTLYASGSGISKSTDQGATWTHITTPAPEVSGLAATTERLYFCGGAGDEGNVDAYRVSYAELDADTVWTDLPAQPSDMTVHPGGGGAKNPGWCAVTSDGEHDIVIVSNKNGGLWRYVEP